MPNTPNNCTRAIPVPTSSIAIAWVSSWMICDINAATSANTMNNDHFF
ncbi:MAG: hypothetical protein SNJ54_09420 [Anaerolineae bacterium]